MNTLRLLTIGAAAVLALACSRETPPAAEDELPTLDVTTWTADSELFMEFPPLVAGEAALFAVHLTRLRDFSALNEGSASIVFTPAGGGAPTTLRGPGPSRPGVFRVEGAMPAAGEYAWALLVDAPGLMDRHDLGQVTVYADQASAVAAAEAAPADDAAAISYLKEPQWTQGFDTRPVTTAGIRRSIRVPAAIQPLTGGEAIVAAPASGRFMAQSLSPVGTRVQAGQELGRLQPRLAESAADRAALDAAVAEARTVLEGGRADLARAEGLLAERAVPARRVEEARRAVQVAEARLRAAEARLAQRDETLRTGGGTAGNAFVLRAPIAGRLAEVYAALGASYDEGAPLFRIVRTDRVELQAQVPPADAPIDDDVEAIAFEVPGRETPLLLEADHMHDAGVIDPRTRALPVQFDVANRAGELLIGQTGTAVLYLRGREELPVVPEAAVLMEAGRPYVFVQTGGETFVRRFIEIAARDSGQVGIRRGVEPGERVVTRGAYDVQLASAAGGVPAEGHVH